MRMMIEHSAKKVGAPFRVFPIKIDQHGPPLHGDLDVESIRIRLSTRPQVA